MKERFPLFRNSSVGWAITWLALVVFIIFLAVKKEPSFDSSIMALLPTSDQQPLMQQATEKMAEGFSKKLILMLSGDDEEKVREAVGMSASVLMDKSSSVANDFSSLLFRAEGNEISNFKNELYPYRFSILDKDIRASLLKGSYKQVMDKALLRLYSPIPMGESSIVEDPFGLFSELSMNRYGGLNVHVSNELLKVTGTEKPTYILIATLSGEAYSPAVQDRVLKRLTELKKTLNEQWNVTLNMSGMLLHAAAGAQQARSEISTIGIGSLLGIVFLMLLIFHKVKPLVLILLTVTVGCLTAAAVTVLVFDRVHLVTFAFGAGLVGVSIDYALHFLCERRVTSSDHILRKILPGLLLALFSSTVAYAAQALTPFPGLRQMAVFSVVGLIASWITVILWFPALTKKDSEQPLKAAEKLNIIRKSFPSITGNIWLVLLLSGMLVLSIKTLWNSHDLDDVTLLQTSPESLLEQEHRVRKALGLNSSSQFLLISGDSLEQCLQKEEQLIPALDDLKTKALLKGYQAISIKLPSLDHQKENIELIDQLYQQQLSSYYDMLKVPEDKLIKARLYFSEAKKQLTPEMWLQQQDSESWKDLIVMQTEAKAATVIRFNGELGNDVKQKLIALSETEKGVIYVDQVKNISDLMGSYRSQVIRWVLLAYVIVFLVLLLRYKHQVWRVMLPPILASAFTLALLVQLEGGLNLFHFMALILVLGIGLDMGIFLFETNDNPHTWLAVTLSTFTSLLAFGLLALSKTPVLHHFGLTVLIGLTFVWLLTPLVRQNSDVHNNGEIING